MANKRIDDEEKELEQRWNRASTSEKIMATALSDSSTIASKVPKIGTQKQKEDFKNNPNTVKALDYFSNAINTNVIPTMQKATNSIEDFTKDYIVKPATVLVSGIENTLKPIIPTSAPTNTKQQQAAPTQDQTETVGAFYNAPKAKEDYEIWKEEVKRQGGDPAGNFELITGKDTRTGETTYMLKQKTSKGDIIVRIPPNMSAETAKYIFGSRTQAEEVNTTPILPIRTPSLDLKSAVGAQQESQPQQQAQQTEATTSSTEQQNQQSIITNQLISRKQIANAIYEGIISQLQSLSDKLVNKLSGYQPTDFRSVAIKGDPSNYLKTIEEIKGLRQQQKILPEATAMQNIYKLSDILKAQADVNTSYENIGLQWFKETKPTFHSGSEWGSFMHDPTRGVIPLQRPAYMSPEYLQYTAITKGAKEKDITDLDLMKEYNEYYKNSINAGKTPWTMSEWIMFTNPKYATKYIDKGVVFIKDKTGQGGKWVRIFVNKENESDMYAVPTNEIPQSK